MGTSHIDSNLVGKDGVETISGFASIAASIVTATALTSLAAVTAGSTIAAGTTVTAGTNIISTAGNITGDAGYVSGGNVRATNYIKVGSRYLFGGAVTNNEASVMAAATAFIATTSLTGGLFLNAISSAGTTWMFDTPTTATKLLIQ